MQAIASCLAAAGLATFRYNVSDWLSGSSALRSDNTEAEWAEVASVDQTDARKSAAQNVR
jgi:hypothetical protein